MRKQVDGRVDRGATGDPMIAATLTRREKRLEFTVVNLDDDRQFRQRNNGNRDSVLHSGNSEEP